MEKKAWFGEVKNDVKNAQKRNTNWYRDKISTHTGAMDAVVLERW
jgi:hypothetical protein